MARYLISPEAQNSLKQIKTFSNDQFGKQRTRAYLKKIMNRFRDLAANPSLGTVRAELSSSYRSSFVGSHTIYYRTILTRRLNTLLSGFQEISKSPTVGALGEA